ncbi:MAG: bifunctional riboflavin kinase/FAD synthetase [Mailhella sp.]|nr:bifunctional riboflavin kinase/FAD synthetase [Mailhella sp.]
MLVSSTPKDLRSLAGWQSCAATIGNFDGVHLGHRELLRRTVDCARHEGMPAVVVTFDPHPAAVFTEYPPRLLCSREQCLELLEELGVDAVLLMPFTRELAEQSAESFCRRVLQDELGVKELFVGYDFRLGCDQAGAARMRDFGTYSLTQVEAVMAGDAPVSSTRIRKALAEGRLDEANALLGRPFSVRGEVVHGAGRGGPLLGVPTANLDLADAQAMPAPAAYATSARLLDGPEEERFWRMAVTSFCKNPTFDGTHLTLETHILDFQGDIYGRQLEVRFMGELRKEKRFNGLDALIAQLKADMDQRRGMPL